MPGAENHPATIPALCRYCLREFRITPGARQRCPTCASPRIAVHPELDQLRIAHLDCDAFYAAVEKRENPTLADKPLIIGGGRRGVVSTACYVARIRGVHSAMPMFKALKLCPDAVVLRPRMELYASVSREIRALMAETTPLIEPLSLDEAFLDLSGTRRLHARSPAATMAALTRRIEAEVGVSASVGLSCNKFLAKIASDLDKPRGFSVIGRAEAPDFLGPRPVSVIWGVGAALNARLTHAGVRTVADLRKYQLAELMRSYGVMGRRLYDFCRGNDPRKVSSDAPVKSVSTEITFDEDLSDLDLIDGHLWRLSEKVAARCKAKSIAGRVATLKLKSVEHRLITRRVSLDAPTQLGDALWRAAAPMLAREAGGAPWRLIGVGLSELSPAHTAQTGGDLLDPDAPKRAAAERAIDEIREKFGTDSVFKGRSLR